MNLNSNPTTATVGEFIPVVRVDWNDYCGNKDCSTCHGRLVGDCGLPVEAGQRVKLVCEDCPDRYGRVLTCEPTGPRSSPPLLAFFVHIEPEPPTLDVAQP